MPNRNEAMAELRGSRLEEVEMVCDEEDEAIVLHLELPDGRKTSLDIQSWGHYEADSGLRVELDPWPAQKAQP